MTHTDALFQCISHSAPPNLHTAQTDCPNLTLKIKHFRVCSTTCATTRKTWTDFVSSIVAIANSPDQRICARPLSTRHQPSRIRFRTGKGLDSSFHTHETPQQQS